MPITLSHTGSSVTLEHFKATAALPRTRGSQGLSVGYSYHGNAYPTGPRRTPERWQFTALVSEGQWQLLQLIQNKSEQAARTAPYTGFEIDLVDTISLVTEAVRSRAASGAVVANADGSVTYAARWLAMFESLEMEREGRRLWAIATLVEGSQTTP